MSSWLRGSWVVLLVAIVLGGAGCQWEVPLDPFIDGDVDASDPDAGMDGATDAPTDGMPMATLTVIRNGTASGTVTSNAVGGAMIDCGATCTAQFPPGTLVTLTEAPDTGATFAGWSGVCSDASPNCSFTLDSDTTVQATFDVSRHTISIAPTGNGAGSISSNVGGIACPGTCEATVDYGTSLTLTATPVAPSIFAGWNDVGCSGTGTCTFTVTQDEVIDAPFALNYTVTVSKNGNGHGTVTSAPGGIACGNDCDQVYSAGTMVTLTAAADADSNFVGWGGACGGTGATCMVTVDDVVSVTATFALKRYTLTATRSGTGGGVVTSNPAGINCGADCDEMYDHGTQVTLSAMADGSSTFTSWSDAGCPGTGACVITLTGTRSLGATFTLNRYQLTVAKSGNGAGLGTVTSTPVGITCGADCDELYDANSMVTLSASAASGATFMGWSGAGCSGTGNCVVTMAGAQNVTAVFVLNQYTLSVNKAGNGAARGTVTSSPAGISCGATCNAGYQFGQSVTLTPTAMSGATFTGWSGGGCSGLGNCVVTVGGDTAVTATFELDTYTLAVVRAGNAASSGSVTSAPAGITCNTATNDCDQGFTFGTAVTLTATAGAGSTFAGWSGGGCSGTTTCMVTVDAAKTVTATFTLDEALTVTKTGAGAPYGTVTSAPTGIACGNDCSENFGVGTMVTLTASVQAGAATFAGWGGACSGPQPTCVVTVAAASNVSASFALVPYVLTAARAGDGSGSIESNLAGISCGSDCTESYGYGTSVVLTATPDAGATFTGWSGGGCSGTGSCTVSVTAATTVTATFQADRVLTVTTGGNGAGTVTSMPGGINCPTDCMETYTHGQMVTLTATPSTGSTFTSWSGGGCSGTGSCTVTMTAARSVQATFTLTTHTLTVSRTGSGAALGTVTSMPAGISCGGDCTETVAYGTQLTLSASAAAGATFTGWSGATCSGTGMCVVTVTGTTTVTATFQADQTLTVARGGTGSAYGLVTATGISCGNDCSEAYPYNSLVELTASVPVSAAATFASWTGGGCSGSQPTCTVRLDQAQMVTATFNIRQHTVSVATNGGNGAGTVTSTPTGISAPGTPSASFNYGTTVTLAASPSTGSSFTGWSGVAGCSGTGSCDVVVDGAKAVTATFTLQRFALSVSKTGTSTALATVTSTPAGISCGATCSAMFDYNTPVQLSVSLMPGVRFMGWSGEGCSGTGTCSVTMTQARNVTAAFEGDKVLDVTVNGNGSGTVVSSPAGIMTPAMTSAAFTHGTPVTLTAAANTTTSNFAGWGGACASAGTAVDCVVTMDQARSATATFTLKTYTLTLNKSGAGVGTVSSNPAGINCGTACATQNASFNHGQTVALSHLAGTDSEFVSWGGACSGATCSPSMTQDRTVTASFKRTDKTLTVTVSGSGTVTSMDGGINAPSDPTQTYPHGTMVTLTAAWNATSHDFVWGGACSGSLAMCTVTMDQARSVTATFTLKSWTLAVAKAGAGTGTVASTMPAGAISCGADCSETVTHGTMVTLTATPTAGDIFYGWSGGGCSGTGPCTTTVTAATTVTATFDNCVRSTQTCSNNNFMQCDATGDFVSHVIPNGGPGGTSTTITYDGTYICPLGCHPTESRCGDVDASNGLNDALDDVATSPDGLDLPLDLGQRTIKAINTSNFDVVNGLTVVTLDNNTPFSLPARVITQTDGPEILVLETRSFTVPAGTTITVTGTRALAIVAHFDIYVAGTLDLSGPAGSASGGGPGHVNTAGCVGTYASLASGGGGLYSFGGASSTGGAGGGIGYFSTRLYLTPLGGGCAGGTGGLVSGGAAGGALQLVSRTQVALAATALINVSGAGGLATCNTVGCTSYRATGGGAGGGVSLESPLIAISDGAVIAGRGGNGAASNSGTVGMPGSAGTTTGSTNGAASSCGGCGTGGVGGTESTLIGSAGTGNAPAIAGGGGSVGRCVTRDRLGGYMPPAGTMKIAFQSFQLPMAR